jgi:hypothetical protein
VSSQTLSEARFGSSAVASPAVAVGAIWLSSTLIAILAPDMISGSEQEHLPLAAITVWLWIITATAYVVMATRRGSSGSLVAGVAAVWACVLLAAVAAPVMETGSDPTRIPLAALLAPPVGALATGFLALHHTTKDPG